MIILKKLMVCTALIMAIAIFASCSAASASSNAPSSTLIISESIPRTSSQSESILRSDALSDSQEPLPQGAATQLYVQFGDEGAPFTMYLYDNDTANAIAHHVGTADWRIPLYNYDGYEHWEVMQYYDIPSRYEIPYSPQSLTSQASGTVYYQEPNRIVLFYGEGQVSGEFTPVGYFDVNETFINAVTNNPVLEGWGNKIIKITAQQ